MRPVVPYRLIQQCPRAGLTYCSAALLQSSALGDCSNRANPAPATTNHRVTTLLSRTARTLKSRDCIDRIFQVASPSSLERFHLRDS